MELTVCDWVILAVAAAGFLYGLFTGLSGALAFLAGTVAGGAAGRLAWTFSAGFLSQQWTRGLAVLVAAILAFGLVRLLVRKTVGTLLAQPGDAIFGSLVGAVVGAALSLASVWGLRSFGLLETPSRILTGITGLVGI